jgi:hypothetical protein
VLVDWRGTLAVTLAPERWVATALAELGRLAADAASVLERLEAVDADERLLTPGMDADPALHLRVFTEVLADALMVGDRHTHDGGAAALGITTLVLPPLRAVTDRRLDLAEALLHRHTEGPSRAGPRLG